MAAAPSCVLSVASNVPTITLTAATSTSLVIATEIQIEGLYD